MVPWWGVLVACILFSIWTLICFLVGAAVKDTVIKKTSEKPDPRLN